MHTSVTRRFSHDRELLYSHFAQFKDFAHWAKLPEGFDFEIAMSETGEIEYLEMTYLIDGEYWKSVFKSIFSEKSRETRTLVTGMFDQAGNEMLGNEDFLIKEMSSRTCYLDTGAGTEIIVDLYVRPSGVWAWLDTYLLLRDWKWRTKVLMDLLDDYLNNHPVK